MSCLFEVRPHRKAGTKSQPCDFPRILVIARQNRDRAGNSAGTWGYEFVSRSQNRNPMDGKPRLRARPVCFIGFREPPHQPA
jgi:hypothetical protein